MSADLVFWCRRCSQSMVLLLFLFLPWLNAHGLHWLGGSLFAFDLAGLPFADPAMALQAGLLSLVESCRPEGQLLIGACLALLLALLLGRVFCSWLCPYGFLSELIHSMRWRGKGHGSANSGASSQYIFGVKTAVYLLAMTVLTLGSYPLLSLLSMPGELSLAPLRYWQEVTVAKGVSGWRILASLSLTLAVPICALVLEALTGRRFWCRFVCPQSVLLGLAAVCLPRCCPGLRIRWQPSACTCRKDAPCRATCALGCNPRQKDGPARRDCTMCGDCVRACASRGGALRWQWRV
ncbi:MAG: 4Fe-4S binding protein [Desulfovibrio sp.]|nr:4Fe-4S binding protein [Desulfovibrio sp.]